MLPAGLVHRAADVPIAYNKWIREQIVDILGLPELYARLPPLFELERLESTELVDKAAALRALADAYAVD